MLKQLILANFKSFGERQVIPLAPITLIFGANSAGKSSILQSLLLLKQTLEMNDDEVVLSPSGPLVDLGGYRDLVHAHDPKRHPEIGVLFDGEGYPPSGIGWSKYSASGDLLNAGPVRDWGISIRNEGVGWSFEYKLNRGVIEIERISGFLGHPDVEAFHIVSLPTPLQIGSDGGTIRLNSDHPFWRSIWKSNPEARGALANELRSLLSSARAGSDDARRRLDRLASFHLLSTDPKVTERAFVRIDELLGALESPDHQAFCDEVGKYLTCGVATKGFLPVEEYDNWHFTGSEVARPSLLDKLCDLDIPTEIEGWSDYLKMSLEGLEYLGPARRSPRRFNTFDGSRSWSTGSSGERAPDLLFRAPVVVDRANRLLTEMGVNYQIRVHRPRAAAFKGMYAVELIDGTNGITVGLGDTGYGIGQILPIIIASIVRATGDGSTVLIEQPELHLHPRLQAELGTVFAEAIQPTPRSQSSFPPIQFLIETHSEHLILRLQRLVREGKLNSDDLSVIYVTKGEGGSVCQHLRLDEEGDFIDPWPEGFFEEGFHEMFASR